MKKSYEIVFETERLILRKITDDDIDNLQKIFRDPIAMQYYPKTYDIDETKDWIRKTLESYEIHNAARWACHLKKTGEFVGSCRLIFQEDVDGKDEVEVGYRSCFGHNEICSRKIRLYKIDFINSTRKYTFNTCG